MTPKPHILFVINSLAGGGAERVLSTLLHASGSWRDCYTMSLALLDDEPRAYEPPAWVETIALDCRGRLLASARALRRLVTRRQPDVTLSFLTRANVANAFAMAGRGRPWIISERVNTSAHLGSGAVAAKALVRLAYPRADGVIAVSEGVAEDLAVNFGVRRERIAAIANPVDHAMIERCAQETPAVRVDGPFVVAAGRLVPNKNFALLIEAFARAGLPGSLVILGEGPERPALEALAARLGLAERLVMPGFVDNPFAVIARADLFALPSNAEGFPNGLVEAMACGLPVVSTNCPSGPSEVLAGIPRAAVQRDAVYEAGALVPPGDAESFAAALGLLSDPALRARCGAAARERSLNFGVEQAAARYWAVIEAAIDRRATRSATGASREPAKGKGALQ